MAVSLEAGPGVAVVAGLMSSYMGAGVDIAAGEAAVDRIRAAVASTHRPGVLGSIGGFGGLFDLAPVMEGRRHPVLVSSTDGVGTKAKVASALARYDTIGIDLVAMCVDDLVCQGAEPLFLLDYLSVGRLDPAMAEAIVAGVADGCRQVTVGLLGGEMAEHPASMPDGDFDLAGFAVGAVERDRLLPQRVEPGLCLVGLPSPNLRANGYSLARLALIGDRSPDCLAEPAWPTSTQTLGQVLLEPSVLYTPAVLALLGEVDVRAVAHVTGGGLPGNVSRILPPGLDAVLDRSTWTVPRVFTEIQERADVADGEMARVFNLGVGMVVAVPAGEAAHAVGLLSAHGHPGAGVVGEVVDAGSATVRLTGAVGH